MKIEETLTLAFNEGTEEHEILHTAYKLITTSYPSVASEAKSHLIMLDHSRMKLATLYYGVCRSISQMRDTTQATYDTQYTRLVKMGRPSKDAIEAEIRSTNGEYAGISKRIKDLEDIKELISMYMRCIDSSRSTVTEILRNVYRID